MSRIIPDCAMQSSDRLTGHPGSHLLESSRMSWFGFSKSTTATWLLPALALFALLLIGEPVFAQEEAPANEGQQNIVIFIIKSLGLFFGGTMLIISVVLVALIVLQAMDNKTANVIPPGFVDNFTSLVNQRKFKEAFEMAKADPSVLGRALAAGMAKLQYGLEEAREASQNTIETIRSDKDQKNNYLAVIGSLGPLLGLVGTVFGMILAFRTLGTSGGGNAQALASDISHALSVTLLGVGVSVPAIFFNAYFRNRILGTMGDADTIATDLLVQMYHSTKKAGGPAPAPTAPVAAPPKA
jgi:biopolymer transport protein ExbB